MTDKDAAWEEAKWDSRYEDEIIEEWLTHEGENYQIFKEIENYECAKILGLLASLIS